MEVVKIRRLINPGRGARPRTKARARRTARPAKNPASILTLGMLNPERRATRRKTARPATRKKGKTKMAKATKKQLAALRKARAARRRMSNPRPHHRRRRTVAVAAPRRRRRVRATSNPRRRRPNGTRIYVMPRKQNRRRGRSNPDVFGMRGAAAGKAILAGLVGVYATKTVTPMVASAVPQVGSSPIISAILSAVIAWGGGSLLSKWDKTAGEGFMFGGLMQAGSQLLNLVVPANPLSLSGLGDWVPGRFSVPENTVLRGGGGRGYLAAPAMPSAPTTAQGMGVASLFR